MEETPMRVRPHHLIDIIAQYGAGQPFEPSAYGHAVHTVAAEVIANPGVRLEFGVGADDICAPCRHLVSGRCDDVIHTLDPPVRKQDYNDALDQRLLELLGMTEGECMTFEEYLALLRTHLEGLAELCAHPGEEPKDRAVKLERGLARLGA
jgi:hypothetical protein